MLIAALTEVVSVGAVLPFLGVLTAPEHVYHHQLMQPVNDLLNITSPKDLLLPLTLIFILAVLVAGIVRLLLLYVTTFLSFATGADISIEIYRRTLYQEYQVHASRNSSEIINGVLTKTNIVIQGVINPVLNLISSIVMIIFIVVFLFAIDPLVALATSLTFGLIYYVVISQTKRRVDSNSKIIAEQSTKMVKSLQEGLGGIRDVIIYGAQEFYCDTYRKADLSLRKATAKNLFISGSPRYAIEALGMSVIVGLSYIVTLRDDGLSTAIPILGALALGAQRLLPIMQQAFRSYTVLKGANISFQDVLKLLEQPLAHHVAKLSNHKTFSPISFNNEIELRNLSFRYCSTDARDKDYVLDNVNLKFTKGLRVGIIGTTGSGKSTLTDIIMGLLSPTSGEFVVDGVSITDKNRREWQDHISHVSQYIYLSDGTIEENIAFGIPKEDIDIQRVLKVAEQAQISEVVDGWEHGYKTVVGERGVRISGGQRQRIGIARALYKRANVLIFDEATSSLDNVTEKAVMSAIDGLGKDLTIFIVAHRLTTLKGCDQIVRLDKNNVVSVLSHQDLFNES